MKNVYGTICFCNDSVLRIKQFINGKTINYPLSDVQSVLEEPESFILQFLNRGAIVEKGTTLSNIILSLSPWKNVLSYFLMIDIDSYCQNCFTEKTTNQDYSYLLIEKRTLFSKKFTNTSKFDISKRDDFFKSIKETELFKNSVDFSTCGYIENDEDGNNYSISDISFNKLKDTPVLLSEKHEVVFFIQNREKNIFYEDISGIEVFSKGNERIKTENFFTFSEIIQSIFSYGLFYENPTSEEEESEYREDISKLIDIVDRIRENEAILKSQNVVPLFKKESSVHQLVYASDEEDDDENKNDTNYNGFDDEISEEIYKKLIGNSNIKLGDIN